MALSIQLQEIATKSAGVYQLVINNTNRARITPPTNLRFVPLNSRRGPVNSLVYIDQQDYAGLESVFGGIKSRDERHGNFGIRISRHLLENGPIVVMNLRRFDDTLDKASVIGMSPIFGESNSEIGEQPYSLLHNTERLWFPDPEQLGLIEETKNYGIAFANVGSKKLNIFVRKSTVTGWNMTVKDWYTKKGKEIPEYIDPYMKMCDTFVDIFVFETDFSDAKKNMANENYGYLFTVDGIKAFYTDDMGVDHDPLNELAQIEDAQFIRKYTGSLIDDLVDASNNVAAIASLVNAYAATDGLMIYVNPLILESDAILDYDADINGAKRPFGIDFLGQNRFNLLDDKAEMLDRVLDDKIDWNGVTGKATPAWLSHLAQECFYGKVQYQYNKPNSVVGGPSIKNNLPAQIKVSELKEFEVATIANEYSGKMIKVLIDVTNKDAINVEYYETAGDAGWRPLQLDGKGHCDFGPAEGFPCSDVATKFRVTGVSKNSCDFSLKISLVEDGSIIGEYQSKLDIVSENAANVIESTYESTTGGASLRLVKTDLYGKQVGGYMIDCWVKADEAGITEAYTFDQPLVRTGDYLIGNTSNLVSVLKSDAIGKIGEFNLVKLSAADLVMFSKSVQKLCAEKATETLTLDDGTVIDGLVKTQLYLVYDINVPAKGESLAPIVLKAYTPREEQFCNGTSARQKRILDLLNEPSFIKGLKALTEYKFRYLIDPFKTYIEPQAKANLATFAETLNIRTITSTPFTVDFRRSTNPYFRKTPTSPLEASYIEKGGNPNLVSSNSFSLPIDGADKIWFFGPGMKNNSTGKETIVPFTGAVGKTFLNKFLDGTLFPYSICANEAGILSVDGMVGTENEWTDDERDYLERMGYNPIITQENIGVTIYGNQTASQRILSDLSKIHISELVLTIQEEMRKMLKNYVFKYNNYQYRLEIYTKAEEIMKQIYGNGGVYWWKNVIDTSNNTQEVINNSMGILDTYIVAVKGGEKWVHRTYLETGANIAGFETLM